MNRLILAPVALVALILSGCGSSDAAKPSTDKDVADFKGNPTSPATQNALRAHFGGGPPGTPTPAAGK